MTIKIGAELAYTSEVLLCTGENQLEQEN